MQEQTITVQIPPPNEHVEFSFPNFMIFKKILLSLEIEILNSNSGLFKFNFFTNSLEFLPFEAKVLIKFKSEIVEIEKTIKLDQTIPSQSIPYNISSYMIREMESYGNNDILIQVEQIADEDNQSPGTINSPKINNLVNDKDDTNSNNSDLISKIQDNTNDAILNNANSSSISKQFATNPVIQNILNKINNPNSQTTNEQTNEITKKVNYNGLFNQGATCYINSAIQSLFHIPFFRRIVYKIRPDKGNEQEKLIVSELQSLFYDLEHGKSTCSTKRLTNSLGMNDKAVLVQQDIQEFLRYFTDTLEKILKKDEKLKDKIQYIFGGKTIQTVKNRNGEILSSNEESISELIIDVDDSVNDSLQKYIKEETIDDYNDEKTGTIQSVTIQTKILNLPRVLRLLIKRYKYDPYKNANVKDNRRMSFADDLDLSPFLYKNDSNSINSHYKLFAVIVHEGSLSCGHYFVYIKPDMKDKWFFFSDSHVHQATPQQAIDENFGGTTHLGKYNENYSWAQNSSAYILIYIRNDAINEMFMQDENEIPQAVKVPKRLTNYMEEKRHLESQKTEDDAENLIVFKVFNERGIINNCEQGKPCLLNSSYSIEISVNMKANAKELYEKISENIKININCIRLWTIGKDFKRLNRVIDPAESINQLHAQYLFFEIKEESDDLIGTEYERIYFIILFTQVQSKPFLFLKTGHYCLIEQNDLTGGYDIMKYSTIVEDAIGVLNTNLGTDLTNEDANIYLADSKKAILQYPTSKCTEENGAIMILRISDNIDGFNETIINELEDIIGLKEKLQFISEKSKEEVEQDKDIQNIPAFNYLDNNHYKLPEEYFEKRHNKKRAKVFSFNDITEIAGIIEVPTNIENGELARFIQKSFKINNFDDEKAVLLIFARDDNLNVPRKKPLPASGFSLLEENLDTIYYSVVSKEFSSDPTSETRIVQFSKDGYSISRMACYFIPERYIHPFIQYYKYNEDLFIEEEHDNDFRIRMFIVTKNNEFGPPIANGDGSGIHFDNEDILRIEKVSKDQIGKELVLIYKAKVDKFNRIYIFGHPFYFAYIENEPLESFQARIYKFLGRQESFKVLKKRSYYQDNHVMKDYIHIDDIENSRVLFLIFEK